MKEGFVDQVAAASGKDARVIRGRVFVGSMSVDVIVDGVCVSFTRRRYGTATYTWADALIDGSWVSLGDPWPCVRPKTSDLAREIRVRIPTKEIEVAWTAVPKHSSIHVETPGIELSELEALIA